MGDWELLALTRVRLPCEPGEQGLKGGPKYDAGYGGGRGEATQQTTEAAGGTRVMTGKERMVGGQGGVSGTTALKMNGSAEEGAAGVVVDASAAAGSSALEEAAAAVAPAPAPAAAAAAPSPAPAAAEPAPEPAAAATEEAVPPAAAAEAVTTNAVNRQYKVGDCLTIFLSLFPSLLLYFYSTFLHVHSIFLCFPL